MIQLFNNNCVVDFVNFKNNAKDYGKQQIPILCLGLAKYLEKFATIVKGTIIDKIEDMSTYDLMFKAVLKGSLVIAFNLYGIKELQIDETGNVAGNWAVLLQEGRKGFKEKNYTRAELYVIAIDQNFLRKTDFYCNAKLLNKLEIENNIGEALKTLIKQATCR